MPVIPRTLYPVKPRIVKQAVSQKGTTWYPETQMHPDLEGEKNRVGFKYNCYLHPLGIEFQTKVKPKIIDTISFFHNRLSDSYQFDGNLKILHEVFESSIRENIRNEGEAERKQAFMINALDIFIFAIENQAKLEKLFQNPALKTGISFCHGWIKRVYNKDNHGTTAYVFEDPRLNSISEYLKISITPAFKNPEPILKALDIVLFLMKEDIYYCPRWITILQEARNTVNAVSEESDYPLIRVLNGLCEICEPMQLTPSEIANVERWH